MGGVPSDCFTNSALPGDGRFPAEFTSQFAGVDGVSSVVPRTIGNVADESPRVSTGFREEHVKRVAERPDQFLIGSFAVGSDVVGIADTTSA